MKEKIVLLDFGASYNQLIIKKLRNFGIYAEMVDHDITASELSKDKSIIGIILSGSPSTVYLEEGLTLDKNIYDLGLPILGICYGMQLMAHQLGGKVKAMGFNEKGLVELNIESTNLLVKNNQMVFMDHGDHVTKLPDGFINHAHTQDNRYSLITNEKRKLYGTQFHPEKDDSKVLERFVIDICKANPNWNLSEYLEDQIKTIRNTVKDKKVLLALSGGFKSSLTAAILEQAIGNQLVCAYVDTGLTLNDNPLRRIKEYLNLNIIEIDAKGNFLHKLKNITEPEEKRKIIGEEYIKVFKEEAIKLGGIELLAQGTDYIQVLESGNKKTGKFVKSHHNVIGPSMDPVFELIEPLKHLFKDEIFQLAEILKLPRELVEQEPFPGEALGVRIVGEITEKKLRIIRESDKILKNEVMKSRLNTKNTQFFTVLSDTKSVTSKDFKRQYSYALIIRAICMEDSISEIFMQIEFHTLRKASKQILEEVEGVNRVLLDMTQKDPNIVEWE